MLELYFVRHGQKLLNLPNPGLTELGIRQAEITGKFLRDVPFERVIASPLLRTQLTAQHIVKNWSKTLAIETDSRLRERMERSDYIQSPETFLQEWDSATHNRNYLPHWGSSSIGTGKRVEELVDEVNLAMVDTKSQAVLLVTHGGTIADFLRNVIKEAELKAMEKVLADGVHYEVLECSITKVVRINHTYKLEMLPSIQHLAAL